MALYADGGMGMVSAPAVFGDGAVLPPGGAAELFADASAYNAVPVILGTNRDEVKLFMAMSPEWVDYRFGFLPRLKDPERYDRAAAYGSLGWRHDGVDSLARILHAAQGDSVFAYRFDWDEEGSILGYDLSQPWAPRTASRSVSSSADSTARRPRSAASTTRTGSRSGTPCRPA